MNIKDIFTVQAISNAKQIKNKKLSANFLYKKYRLQVTREELKHVFDNILKYQVKPIVINAVEDVYFLELSPLQAAKKHGCSHCSIYNKIKFINDYYSNR